MPRRSAQETFDRFLTDLEPRLNILGQVRTGDIWTMLRHKYAYSYITRSFKEVMELMAEQGKAVQIRNGLWNITKPNSSKAETLNVSPALKR